MDVDTLMAKWSHFYITNTEELKIRQHHVSTWNFVRGKLVIVAGERVGIVYSRDQSTVGYPIVGVDVKWQSLETALR